MEHTETHIVPEQSIPIRLQEYGVGVFKAALTKSALKKALKKRCVTVNNQIASTATFIYGGETIAYTRIHPIKSKKELVLPLKILYEDDYLAMIHKPAGILVSGNSFKTIARALPQNLKKSPLADGTEPQPVHRLDYPTTGILLVAKTQTSIRLLNKLFENKGIYKTYYAVTIGQMEKEGILTADIDGKTAVSGFSLQRTVASERFKALNLIRLHPQTGRRHQLRKHLYAIGNPILGDQEYGIEAMVLKGKGLYLHAYSLQFTHPFTGKKIHVEAELPTRFTKLFPPL